MDLHCSHACHRCLLLARSEYSSNACGSYKKVATDLQLPIPDRWFPCAVQFRHHMTTYNNIPTISNMFIRCNLSKIYGLATHIFMVNGHVVSVVSISFNICEMGQNFDLCENKLISAFVFTTQTVQFIFLNLKFKASGHLLRMFRPVCIGPGQKQCDGSVVSCVL